MKKHRHTQFLFGLFLFIGLFGCAESSKDSSSDSASSEEKQTTTMTGTLSLDSQISTDQADGLTPGEAIPEATVFLKGLPDQTATSDAQGHFTLAIETEDLALLEPEERTILMWKTTPKVRRFGTAEKFSWQAGTEIPLGAVTLTYTNGIHITLNDSVTKDVIAGDCTIAIEGFGDKLEAVKKNAGQYDTSYMPADDYTFTFSCDQYEAKTETYTVPAATKLNSWLTWSVDLTPAS